MTFEIRSPTTGCRRRWAGWKVVGRRSLVHLILVVALAIPWEGFAAPQDASCVVRGRSLAYEVTAPQGWTIIDCRTERDQSPAATLLPEGSDPRDPPPQEMKVSIDARSGKPGQTLTAVMDIDRKFYTDIGTVVTRGAPVTTADHRTAQILRFSGTERWPHWTAYAYISGGSYIIVAILTCDSSTHYEASYPLFEQLVQSFRFVRKKGSEPSERPPKNRMKQTARGRSVSESLRRTSAAG